MPCLSMFSFSGWLQEKTLQAFLFQITLSNGLMGDNINMYVQSLEPYSVLAKVVMCGAEMRRVRRNKKLEVLCVLLSNPGGACPVAERASAL